jgi:hypothetical protein
MAVFPPVGRAFVFGMEQKLREARWFSATPRGWRWLRWLELTRPINDGLYEPLFFHHIAKTGGTSLIEALRSITPARLTSSEHGNLSARFVEALVARGLVPGQFIYGHPAASAALPLRGRARIITLLREPRDQVISNYFWLRKDRRVPDHAAARRLGFREFLLAHPYFAIFQTASLHVGIEERPIARAEELVDRLPQILAYLDEMFLIGTANAGEQVFTQLAAEKGIEGLLKFPHRRKTRLSAARRVVLNEQFAELQCNPTLAVLFAAERTVFERAKSLSDAQWRGSRHLNLLSDMPRAQEPD